MQLNPTLQRLTNHEADQHTSTIRALSDSAKCKPTFSASLPLSWCNSECYHFTYTSLTQLTKLSYISSI